MGEILNFVNSHRYFSVAMVPLNYVLARILVVKISIYMNRLVLEAMGGRNDRRSLYKKCLYIVKHSITEYEKKEKKAGFYISARDKMKKCGYSSQYAPLIYLSLKYLAPAILFIVSFTYNSFYSSLIPALLFFAVVEAVAASRKKGVELKFQKSVYKIYKYLHNQISSGVKVTDAIKTVYTIIDDRELKDILVQLAARYELTLDIDASLEEFKSNFDIQEVETLCVALKQGIETGDNQELLARQEDVMFKKYFNYIQAETDSCKTRGVIAVALFTAIIVIMIAVPLFNDVTTAVDKIFIN